MKTAEEILREYINFKDVNGNKTVKLLPLTIIDIMEEYSEQFKLKQPQVSNNEVAVCLKPDHVICCLKQDGLCTEDVSDCEFRQTDC